jgi:hypothetical protein
MHKLALHVINEGYLCVDFAELTYRYTKYLETTRGPQVSCIHVHPRAENSVNSIKTRPISRCDYTSGWQGMGQT